MLCRRICVFTIGFIGFPATPHESEARDKQNNNIELN